jgi:hypothetical protein
MVLDAYILEYFLFTFLASFGVLQIALAKKSIVRVNFGAVVLIGSYFWFFTSRDRNVHTVVEGSQLFLIFALGAVSAVIITRIFNLLVKKK